VQESVARLEEYKRSIDAKIALRNSNLNPERPGKFRVELLIYVSLLLFSKIVEDGRFFLASIYNLDFIVWLLYR